MIRNPGSSDGSTRVEEAMSEIRGHVGSLLGKTTLLWLLTARLGPRCKRKHSHLSDLLAVASTKPRSRNPTTV